MQQFQGASGSTAWTRTNIKHACIHVLCCSLGWKALEGTSMHGPPEDLEPHRPLQLQATVHPSSPPVANKLSITPRIRRIAARLLRCVLSSAH